LVAAVGNAQTFARGRDLAAWLGLVPRQITTGGKPRLVGITKAATNTCANCLSTAPDP
jgi:transposase